MLKNSCIICKNKNFEIISNSLRDSKKYKVIQCCKCSHIQISPIPKDDEEIKFYNENLQQKNIHDIKNLKKLYEKSLDDTERRVKLVSKLSSKKEKILEIGSGHGFFLEKMNKKGFDITGIEISQEKQKILKKTTNARILELDLNHEKLDIGKFDTIVLFHVLEHMKNPIDFLDKCKKNLNFNGKIIVEVPNVNDFQITSNKEYREFYWQRAHVSYFSPKILKKIFQENHFKNIKIIGVHRYSIENFFNWKLNKQPQIENPKYKLESDYLWIDKFYKNKLEKSLKCDTLIVISQ